ALRGRPEPRDRGEHARPPQRALAHRSDVHRRDPRAPVELQQGDVVARPVRDYVVAVDYDLRDRVLLTASPVRVNGAEHDAVEGRRPGRRGRNESEGRRTGY